MFRIARKLLTLFMCSVAATTLTAHPHVFIDTGLDIVVDAQRRVTHVRVVWEYDALYSLLVTEDMGLDPDGDAELTAAELDQLNGFDMQWIEGFKGDLELVSEGQEISLSGPQEIATEFSDGRIRTSHLRALATPVPAWVPLIIRPYDPTYYTDYAVTLPVTTTGRSACTIAKSTPDAGTALGDVQAALAALDPDKDPADIGLPDIGAKLATTVTVTCAKP